MRNERWTSPTDIVINVEGLYEGHIIPYHQALIKDSTMWSNPYHNIRHSIHVMWVAYAGGKFHRLSPRELRNLIIAAIFHDFNHSGKIRGKDKEEIETAILMLRKYIQPEDFAEFDNIVNLLWATEFPYTIPTDKLSVSQQILRDADMSQNFADVWIQQSWFGLAEELGLDPIAFLRTRPAFLKSIVFHSAFGRHAFETKRQPSIEEAETHIYLLDHSEPPAHLMAA